VDFGEGLRKKSRILWLFRKDDRKGFFGLVGWNKTEKYHEQPRLAVVVHQLQAHPFMPASADSWAVNFDPRIFLRPSTLQCEQKRPGLPADQQRTVRFRVSGYDWGGAG
jgi:hypothetical protein